MLGFFAAPMFAAWLAYFGWHPDEHKNYGSLLKVAPLTQTEGTRVDGSRFSLDALKGKWVMVYIGASSCNDVCQKQLYYMRQSRLVLGKDQDRVARVWVLSGQGQPDAALLRAHSGLVVWRPAHASFLNQFPAERTGATHIYLVDPLGNLMMRFPENIDPKRLIKDMKLLLKASQVG